MTEESQVYIAAFLGAATGLPAGFLAIEAIRLLVSKVRDRSGAGDDILEWAVRQPGVSTVWETTVAGNWVRTFDLSEIYTLGDRGERVPIDQDGIPGRYVVQVVGVARTVGNPPLRHYASEHEAAAAHRAAVADVRRKIGLPPA